MPEDDRHAGQRSLLLELMREGAVTVQTPYAASAGGRDAVFRTVVHYDGNVIVALPGHAAFEVGTYARHTAAVEKVVRQIGREAALVAAALKAGGYGLAIIRCGATAWAGVGAFLPWIEQEAASLTLVDFSHLYAALALAGLTEGTRLCGRWGVRSWLRKHGFR